MTAYLVTTFLLFAIIAIGYAHHTKSNPNLSKTERAAISIIVILSCFLGLWSFILLCGGMV